MTGFESNTVTLSQYCAQPQPARRTPQAPRHSRPAAKSLGKIRLLELWGGHARFQPAVRPQQAGQQAHTERERATEEGGRRQRDRETERNRETRRVEDTP